MEPVSSQQDARNTVIDMRYQAYAREIKGALENLLDRLEIRFEVADFDDDLHAACRRAASDRGISLDRDINIGPYIPLGVVLAKTAYAHLPGNDSRIYIALFTAALAAVEDLCRCEYELLKGFCLRYWKGLKHGHPILDDYDLILRELPQRFEFVVADMMLQSNMDFITSLVLEYDMQDRPVRTELGNSSSADQATRCHCLQRAFQSSSKICQAVPRYTHCWHTQEMYRSSRILRYEVHSDQRRSDEPMVHRRYQHQ